MVELVLTLVLFAAEPPQRRPVFVSFEAPSEGCPDRTRYEGELRFRSDRIVIVAQPESTASVAVRIAKKGKRFDGSVLVTTNTGRAVTKKVSGPKCESVTAALSLAAALVLDPEGAKLGVLPVELPPPPPPPTVEPTPPPAPEPVVEPTPIPTPPVVEVVTVPVPTVVEPPALTVSLLGLAEVSTTISGAVDPSAGLMLELSSRPFTAQLVSVSRLSATLGTGRTVSATAGTVVYAFHANGQLESGLGRRFGIIRPELLASLHVTSVTLRGQGADEVYASTRWLADVGPRARVSAFFGAWEASLAAGVGASLTREQYRIDPDGVVFTVPAVAFSAGLAVGRALP